MTTIITYEKVHQDGIDKMMNEISLEFDEWLFRSDHDSDFGVMVPL